MTGGIIYLDPETISHWFELEHGRFWIRQPGQTMGGIIVFAASWCGYCKRLEKTLQEMQLTNRGPCGKIFVIDVDENPNTVSQFKALGYEVVSYPTILQYYGSGLIGPLKYTGNRDAASLNYLLQSTRLL